MPLALRADELHRDVAGGPGRHGAAESESDERGVQVELLPLSAHHRLQLPAPDGHLAARLHRAPPRAQAATSRRLLARRARLARVPSLGHALSPPAHARHAQHKRVADLDGRRRRRRRRWRRPQSAPLASSPPPPPPRHQPQQQQLWRDENETTTAAAAAAAVNKQQQRALCRLQAHAHLLEPQPPQTAIAAAAATTQLQQRSIHLPATGAAALLDAKRRRWWRSLHQDAVNGCGGHSAEWQTRAQQRRLQVVLGHHVRRVPGRGAGPVQQPQPVLLLAHPPQGVRHADHHLLRLRRVVRRLLHAAQPVRAARSQLVPLLRRTARRLHSPGALRRVLPGAREARAGEALRVAARSDRVARLRLLRRLHVQSGAVRAQPARRLGRRHHQVPVRLSALHTHEVHEPRVAGRRRDDAHLARLLVRLVRVAGVRQAHATHGAQLAQQAHHVPLDAAHRRRRQEQHAAALRGRPTASRQEEQVQAHLVHWRRRHWTEHDHVALEPEREQHEQRRGRRERRVQLHHGERRGADCQKNGRR